MAKNLCIIGLVLFLYSCSINTNKIIHINQQGKEVVVHPPVQVPAKTLTLKEIYTSQLGITEATGNNDGPEVEMYLRSTGHKKGASWCAAFVHWCLDSAKIKNTITAWSPTAHNPNNIIWFHQQLKQVSISGDVFTLYSVSMGRIHHTGFFDEQISDKIVQTVEGNTNSGGSVDGDGVYKRKRSYNSLYSITRWTK